MWLRKLKIANFRKIENLVIDFPRGLCVIVGENNAGKTTIMDSLRLMLFSGRDQDALRLNEDDFRSESNYAPIEISCTFTDLKDIDEVRFHECLVDVGDGKFEVRISMRCEFNSVTRRINVRTWGGETEGGSFPSDLHDNMESVYLKPLRDPETGLRPGRYSQISRLIDSLTESAEQEGFVTIASEANVKIRELPSVSKARDDINIQMSAIAGSELTQSVDLIFSNPTFSRIVSGLQPEIEGLPFALNGLGYNNLVYTAATLGTLQQGDSYSFRSILVEEPEAHLHPHLQVLLLRYLNSVAAKHEANEVQVITSSHSPILVSQAPIDSVVSVHEIDGKVSAVSVCSIEFDKIIKKKLQRFLDATRGELFFARRILMVEGIAEAILLPVLAEISGGCLKDSSVTILNVDGLNFNAFLPLFGEKKLSFPVAIMTDGDAKVIGGGYSTTFDALKRYIDGVENMCINCSEITFEHELARSPNILSHMVAAFKNLHPITGKTLEEAIAKCGTNDEKADCFYKTFIDSKTSKGSFAQELASLLEDAKLDANDVPDYIIKTLKFLSVLEE